MIEKITNTNGYKWVQKCTLCGNYVTPSINMVTCLILPEGEVRKNFKREVNKLRVEIIEVLVLANNIEIIQNQKEWCLKYLYKDEVIQIPLDGPTDIEMIYDTNNKKYVIISIYNPKEYLKL